MKETTRTQVETMTTHPTEDELIQHGSDDLPADAAAEIGVHLGSCEPCRAICEEVRAVLRLAEATPVPEPGDGFEARMWLRIAPQLRRPDEGWHWQQFAAMAGWAALVAAIAGLTVMSRGPQKIPTAVAAEQSAPTAPERVLLTALDEHFTQTELLLVELLNAPDTTGDSLQFERAAAGDLVASGRLYRETAQETGQQGFADILDDLEPVLVDVARSPAASGSRDLDAWRARIEDAGLLFKVRAATNEVKERRDPLATASKGAL
ncbi:MAG: hypothetical protein ABI051_15575 [Vicinamibacterales bacterium]